MVEKQTETLDSIFEDFIEKFEDSESCLPLESQQITIRIPENYKIKYELLQKRTRNRFGKLLKEVLKKTIDRVSVE